MRPFCERNLSSLRSDGSEFRRILASVGQLIRDRRRAVGAQQTICARMIGVSKRTVQLWENGKVKPTGKAVAKIVKFLAFDPFCSD